MKTLILAAVVAFMPLGAFSQDFQAGADAYERGDYETALREWRPLAEQGYAPAQNNLALMYYHGQGVTQDYAEAVRWYRKAAEQGDALAQSNLSTMYYLGESLTQDYVTAHMWANIAAAGGNDTAAANRDIVASQMTAEAIAEAQRRARVCMESGYQDCD